MSDLIDRAEVLKIIRNSYSTAFVTIKDYSDYLIKKIKKIQSPESTTDVQDSVSKDTNTQRSGCGISLKIYIGDRRMYCGEIDPITNHKVLCEKCQGKDDWIEEVKKAKTFSKLRKGKT